MANYATGPTLRCRERVRVRGFALAQRLLIGRASPSPEFDRDG